MDQLQGGAHTVAALAATLLHRQQSRAEADALASHPVHADLALPLDLDPALLLEFQVRAQVGWCRLARAMPFNSRSCLAFGDQRQEQVRRARYDEKVAAAAAAAANLSLRASPIALAPTRQRSREVAPGVFSDQNPVQQWSEAGVDGGRRGTDLVQRLCSGHGSASGSRCWGGSALLTTQPPKYTSCSRGRTRRSAFC